MKGAEHIHYTKREWRQLKREQLRTLKKAIKDFRMECAYVPGYPTGIETLQSALKFLQTETSAKNWGH